MQAICLHDKNEILAFLQQNTYLHLYSIGDLDDFFWPYTTWYARRENDQIRAIILFYSGISLPVLLALGDDLPPLRALLAAILHLLPAHFYAHLSPGLEVILEERYTLESHGQHYKMALTDPSRPADVDVSQVMPLSLVDLDEVTWLYEISYPGNAFNPRMLETGQYFGLRNHGSLVSIAGVHVYSERYGVAALGNITTHPAYRGQGLGRAVTAKLCQALLERVEHIGLNVKVDNATALGLYERLGFEIVCPYGEFMVRAL